MKWRSAIEMQGCAAMVTRDRHGLTLTPLGSFLIAPCAREREERKAPLLAKQSPFSYFGLRAFASPAHMNTFTRAAFLRAAERATLRQFVGADKALIDFWLFPGQAPRAKKYAAFISGDKTVWVENRGKNCSLIFLGWPKRVENNHLCLFKHSSHNKIEN